MIKTKLEQSHYDHLIDESFTPDEILELEGWGVRSIDLSEALKLGIKKWDGAKNVSDGGLYFPFAPDYGQVRFDTPLQAGDRPVKYLGPSKPSRAWYPCPGIKAITEGWKDAAMPTVRGCPTGAIVGVDNIIHCLPLGCEIPIIFDSDGWRKPQVVRALVWGALWTNAGVNLFPEMPDHPNGGACEFFKGGGTIEEYQDLIGNAMAPEDFIGKWISRWDGYGSDLRADCAKVATDLIHAIENAETFIAHLQRKVSDKAAEWLGKQ